MHDTLNLAPRRGLICHSARMRALLRDIERVAHEPGGVLIAGEPGTGRGLVARTIHGATHDLTAPFVAVYCHKADTSRIEMELFGTMSHGPRTVASTTPFTHAQSNRERIAPGSLLHRARNGTVYLVHIETLPERVQLRLANVLRDREALIGQASRPEPFSVRPMVAVDARFANTQDDGRLRPELARLVSVHAVTVPALRDRREDLADLAAFFVERACRQLGMPSKKLAPELNAVLAALPWKGNAREMNALIETLVRKAGVGDIALETLMAYVRLEHVTSDHSPRPSVSATLRQARQQFEREYIAAVLAHHRGRIPEAARALGIQRTNLYRKLRTLQLIKPRSVGAIAPEL